jgi:hypothetical protein
VSADAGRGAPSGTVAPAARSKAAPTRAQVKTDGELADLLYSAVEAASDEGGWAHLGRPGGPRDKRQPSFDARSYGKRSELVAATRLFEIRRDHPHDGKPAVLCVRGKSIPVNRIRVRLVNQFLVLLILSCGSRDLHRMLAALIC